MIKDAERERATNAFINYALLGCPSDEDYRRKKGSEDDPSEYRDVLAVNAMFDTLDREGKEYISKAVRDVYMYYPRGLLRRNTSGRVLAHAMSAPADVRTVYRWLKYAKKLFNMHRGAAEPEPQNVSNNMK